MRRWGQEPSEKRYLDTQTGLSDGFERWRDPRDPSVPKCAEIARGARAAIPIPRLMPLSSRPRADPTRALDGSRASPAPCPLERWMAWGSHPTPHAVTGDKSAPRGSGAAPTLPRSIHGLERAPGHTGSQWARARWGCEPGCEPAPVGLESGTPPPRTRRAIYSGIAAYSGNLGMAGRSGRERHRMWVRIPSASLRLGFQRHPFGWQTGAALRLWTT